MSAPRRREFKSVPIDFLHRDPHQPRKEFDSEALQELAASIKSEGMMQPPGVKPHPKRQGHYLIVWGERRIRATKLNEATEVEVFILYGKVDTFTGSLVENLLRKDLNPIEEARGYDELRRSRGWKTKEIHQATGVAEQTIKNKLRSCLCLRRFSRWCPRAHCHKCAL